MRLLSPDEFRADARARRATTDATVVRLATSPAAEVAGASRTLRFCFSDGSVDRVGDKIDPKGWDLQSFNSNPVALWAHMSTEPPIGRARNVGVVGGRLMGDIEFAPAETYAFADTIYRLAKGGYVNAVSVGFQPTKWDFAKDEDRPFGIDFKNQTLLEISLCPIPANENALIEARAKGIDTRPLLEWAERRVDKAGRRISTKNRTKLEEALSHHAAAMKSHEAAVACIQDVLDSDDPDPDDRADPTPSGVVDEPAKRLKEARAFLRSLQPIAPIDPRVEAADRIRRRVEAAGISAGIRRIDG